MQSRLWEPLYQEKVVTVQLGRGQPSGGTMEERTVGRKAERAVRVKVERIMAGIGGGFNVKVGVRLGMQPL
jgi:hypothetical protein